MADSAARKTASGNGSPADIGPETPESLDQVRNILFGGQMRMVDSRLRDLEERFFQEQAALRNELARQLADLGESTKSEFTAHADRLTAEKAKRGEELKALGNELKDALKSLERRHQKLEETASLADAELRDQLLQQSAALLAEVTRTAERISTELDRSTSTLRAEKVDKSVLATALTEVATKLTGNGHAAGSVRSKG
jgi:hypothetical protein